MLRLFRLLLNALVIWWYYPVVKNYKDIAALGIVTGDKMYSSAAADLEGVERLMKLHPGRLSRIFKKLKAILKEAE